MKGIHVLADFKGCSFKLLDDLPFLEKVLTESAHLIGATILNTFSHKFDPQGVTVVITLQESHISIHSAPEFHGAHIDIFTCGTIKDPEIAFEYISSCLNAEEYEVQIIERSFNDSEMVTRSKRRYLAKEG